MQQYEFKVVQFHHNGEYTTENIVNMLNGMGADGWELKEVTPGHRYTFQRPKQSAEPPRQFKTDLQRQLNRIGVEAEETDSGNIIFRLESNNFMATIGMGFNESGDLCGIDIQQRLKPKI